MRLLFVQRATSAADQWTMVQRSDATSQFEGALTQLKSLSILYLDESQSLMTLNETFRQQLAKSLLER